jgi:hypothetical protein
LKSLHDKQLISEISPEDSPPASQQQACTDQGKYAHHNADGHTRQKRWGVSSFARVHKVVMQQMSEG